MRLPCMQRYERGHNKDDDLDVIPRFYGHSTHWGVAMTCLEKERDDFEDNGLENLSYKLNLSALRCVQVMSDAGILHNDLALRNFVQSRTDPTNKAKLIDLGRARFCTDTKRLTEQVELTKQILGL